MSEETVQALSIADIPNIIDDSSGYDPNVNPSEPQFAPLPEKKEGYLARLSLIPLKAGSDSYVEAKTDKNGRDYLSFNVCAEILDEGFEGRKLFSRESTMIFENGSNRSTAILRATGLNPAEIQPPHIAQFAQLRDILNGEPTCRIYIVWTCQYDSGEVSEAGKKIYKELFGKTGMKHFPVDANGNVLFSGPQFESPNGGEQVKVRERISRYLPIN